MTSSFNETRTGILLAALLCCGGLGALAQDSSGQDSPARSLGDVARQTRQERSAPSHVSARKVATEDFEGPDASGVWRMRLCTVTPCYELSITLPKAPKWSQATLEPRPVLIPAPSLEEDSSRAIRVYGGESNDPKYFVDDFKRTFLQAWFARPEYFGQSAKLLRDEHVSIDSHDGVITHFTITTAVMKYRGLSVVAGSNQGNFGFACVFHEEDSAVGTSICDAIVKSARYQELRSSFASEVYPPVEDSPDDPPDAPDEDDAQ